MATTCGASGSSLVVPGALSTAATEVARNHSKLFRKANHEQIKYKLTLLTTVIDLNVVCCSLYSKRIVIMGTI